MVSFLFSSTDNPSQFAMVPDCETQPLDENGFAVCVIGDIFTEANSNYTIIANYTGIDPKFYSSEASEVVSVMGKNAFLFFSKNISLHVIILPHCILFCHSYFICLLLMMMTKTAVETSTEIRVFTNQMMDVTLGGAMVGYTLTARAVVSVPNYNTTRSPTGPVVFLVNGLTADCNTETPFECVVLFGAVGVHSIVANFLGSTNYFPSTSSLSLTVSAVLSQVVLTSTSPVTVQYGVPVTLSGWIHSPIALAAPPAGSVVVVDQLGNTLPSNPAAVASTRCNISSCNPSTDSMFQLVLDQSVLSQVYVNLQFRVYFSPSLANFSSGTSSAVFVVRVTAASMTLSVSNLSPTQPEFMQSVVISGTVKASAVGSLLIPVGSVVMISNTSVSSIVSSTGAFSLTWPGGSVHAYQLTLNLLNSDHRIKNKIISVNIQVVVERTATHMSIDLPSSMYLQSVIVTAVVTPVRVGGVMPAGLVTFSDDQSSPITSCIGLSLNASGVSSCLLSALPIGVHSVVASFADPTLSSFAASSNSVQITVLPKTSTLTLETHAVEPSSSVLFGSSVEFMATATSTFAPYLVPSGTVDFTVSSASTAQRVLCNAVPLNSLGVAVCQSSLLPFDSSTVLAVFTPTSSFALQQCHIVDAHCNAYSTPTVVEQFVLGFRPKCIVVGCNHYSFLPFHRLRRVCDLL